MHRILRSRRSAFAACTALAGLAVTTVGVVGATGQASGSYPATATAAAPLTSGNIVVDWNKELVRIIGTPGAQPATVHPTRSLAILHGAIYASVVSITHSNPPYLFSLNAPSGARPDAAAAEAGHDTLAALYPSWTATLDQQLAGELAAIPDGAAKQQGIQVGYLAAELMLAARADDGSGATPPPLPASTQPGSYQLTPPTFAPAVFTQWPHVTPFVLPAADHFRSAPPPALTSAAYAQALNEVKSLGQKTSTSRTADQTVIAKFWAPAPWITWNGIAENAALAHHTDLDGSARLFALLNLSFADTTIAFYDAKYHYHLWRPISAIRAAGDPNWTPLNLTAPDPSYPGAHSALGAAAAAVLASVFGDRDRIAVTSPMLPGVVRTFDSYSAAATETGLSRIYAGVHTRIDHAAGLQMGQEVARFVLDAAGSPGFGLRGS
jgi:membrane-associated phospholipid phosphatase